MSIATGGFGGPALGAMGFGGPVNDESDRKIDCFLNQTPIDIKDQTEIVLNNRTDILFEGKSELIINNQTPQNIEDC